MIRYYVNKAGRGGTTPWLVWRSVDDGEWQLTIPRGFESFEAALMYAKICIRADHIQRSM